MFSPLLVVWLTLCSLMDCSMPGFSVLHHLSELMSIELVISNRLILCYPLLWSPQSFSVISVFSSELALCIRWPKYQSFRFSINPSNEYSGFISFRIDWFDLAHTSAPLWLFSPCFFSFITYVLSSLRARTWSSLSVDPP